MTANTKALVIALAAIFLLSWFGKGGYKAAILLTIILGIVFFFKGIGSRGFAL